MQDATVHTPEIIAQVKERGCVLMLDFDGTISPIVSHHMSARISPHAKVSLVRIARKVPLAIISGRGIDDLRERVGIEGIAYAGCYGIEMYRDGTYMSHPVPERSASAFASAKRKLRDIAARYRASIEDKRFTYALHYRFLTPPQQYKFRREVLDAITPALRAGHVHVLDELFTIDVMPGNAKHKGHAARELYDALSKADELPVFIGDSSSDEEAFRALKGGITIQVGAPRHSAARYFFRTRPEVDAFLALLARNC